jgi:hypothetical protein
VKRDKHLREALVKTLIVEPDRKLAGEILERWDELVTGEDERDAELARYNDHAYEVGFGEGYEAKPLSERRRP